MDDQNKTKDQLVTELAELRQRVVQQDDQLATYRRGMADQRLINNRMPILMATAGMDGYYREVNAAFERILGWSEQESLSRPFLEFIHPGDRAAATETFKQLKPGDKVTDFVNRNICKDGSYRWFKWTVISIPNRDVVFGIGQDITAEKHAEQQRNRSHAVLNATIECLPFDFFALDMDGRYVLVNSVAMRHYSNMIGKTPEEVSPTEHDLTVWLDNNRRAFAGERVEGEVESTVHGEKRHYHNIVTPIRDDDEFYGILGVNVDITERVRAEQALQQAHDRLEQRVEQRTAELKAANRELQREVAERQQAEATLDAFFGASTAVLNILDEKMRYIKSDGLTPTYFGLDSQSIAGRSAREFVPEFIDRIHPMIRQVLETGKPIYNVDVESPVPSRSGDVAYWRVSYFPVPLPGGKRGMGIVGIETTEMKLAEKALLQAHEQLQAKEATYRSLLEASPDAVVMSDLEGRVAFASRQTWELLGLADTEEIVGRRFADYLIEQDRGRVMANFASLLREGVRRNTGYTAIRKDGTGIPVNVSSSVVRDANGNVRAAMAIIHDVTKRQRAEQTIERERQTLLHVLQASDHERQLIAYDIHDGLAQQLAGALMQFQVFEHLRGQAPTKARTAYDAGVEMVQQAHREARRLISGVRPPALDESGVAVALAHLVHEHRKMKGLEIEYHDDVTFDRLSPVVENAIYRIAQEAVGNACQHSASSRVKVSLVQQGELVRLDVHDWGTGFDPEAVPEHRFGVSGIRERTRLMGGQCLIESRPGEGTRVRVTLPILKAE